ncbi:MAG: AAA family ATPase [Acidimicrobiales bacterium]
MLLRFEVSNYRSILDPVELSMIAVDKDRAAAREFELLAERVLSIAGIYGPNASGKSNLVEAIAWLSRAVGRSLRAWDEFIPREPFKFGQGPKTPSTYEVEMVIEGVRYAYRVDVDDSAVLFEGLYSYPERRRRVLFEREDLEIRFRRGLGTLAGTRELLTPTTLALSAAMRFNEPEVQPFGHALAGIQVLGVRRRTQWPRGLMAGGPDISRTERLFDERGPSMQSSLFDDPDSALSNPRESALALLRFADLGIDDVQIVEDEADEAYTSTLPPRGPQRHLRLMHRVAGQDVDVPFDLDEESAGTRTWFQLIGPTLSALRSGRILLIDEIDASLHPRLSARLLELFQDLETNPFGAQLIFTTHDTSLLNYLNRDEVWLTEKGESGATTLSALAEFGGDKVRRSLNLEKAYLQGRFGAVPELDQFILRQALGLVSSDA